MLAYADYFQKVYQNVPIWERSDKGPAWKVTKYCGIRTAYLLYRLNCSANALNIFFFFVILSGFILLLQGPGNIITWFLGIICIWSSVFIDGVDGALARAQDKTSLVGAVLDDVGPEISRTMMIVYLSLQSRNHYFLILSALSAYILVFFIKRTWDNLLLPTKWVWIKNIFTHPVSPVGVRFMLGVLPALLGIFAFFEEWLRPFALALSIGYIIMALCWLLLCASTNQSSKEFLPSS
ncbi:MAG: CDP-alcohol phosphatidyltransferase family protein [Deltaproteobacteria bacterium]|nr:CDP-alcohol phosphatidyltransferase family protein [Deltaproteobacteria bacterium]